MNNISISERMNCKVFLYAVNDTATTIVPNSVVIDVLTNDDHNSCSALQFDTVVGSGAKHGTVKIVAVDSSLV